MFTTKYFKVNKTIKVNIKVNKTSPKANFSTILVQIT